MTHSFYCETQSCKGQIRAFKNNTPDLMMFIYTHVCVYNVTSVDVSMLESCT